MFHPEPHKKNVSRPGCFPGDHTVSKFRKCHCSPSHHFISPRAPHEVPAIADTRGVFPLTCDVRKPSDCHRLLCDYKTCQQILGYACQEKPSCGSSSTPDLLLPQNTGTCCSFCRKDPIQDRHGLLHLLLLACSQRSASPGLHCSSSQLQLSPQLVPPPHSRYWLHLFVSLPKGKLCGVCRFTLLNSQCLVHGRCSINAHWRPGQKGKRF